LLLLFIAFDSQEVQYLTDILKNCSIQPDFSPHLINVISPGKILVEDYFSPLLSDFVPGLMK